MQLINLNITKKQNLEFDKPGHYVVFFRNLSGKFSFKITSEQVDLNVFGFFLGKDSDNFQLETQQYHMAPHSTSNLLIKGVFGDKSKLRYRGLIRIEKSAQASHAYQKNQNLILSDSAFVDSKPELEILANDVFCTHGTSTGQLNKTQLNYLVMRGIDHLRAEKLMIEGFINDFAKLVLEKTDYQLKLNSYAEFQ